MRNGYREKAIACAILHHLESYLLLWEQNRRYPLILMLYASVKVIMLVWKIMGNTGFILDILSALTRTPKQMLWSGKDTEKGHCSLRWLQKVQQTGRHSKEMEINTFLLWDTTDKEGEATSWPNEKHVFFLMKACQSYAPKVPFKTYWTYCISCQKIRTFFGNWPHQICSPSSNHWMSHLFPWLF